MIDHDRLTAAMERPTPFYAQIYRDWQHSARTPGLLTLQVVSDVAGQSDGPEFDGVWLGMALAQRGVPIIYDRGLSIGQASAHELSPMQARRLQDATRAALDGRGEKVLRMLTDIARAAYDRQQPEHPLHGRQWVLDTVEVFSGDRARAHSVLERWALDYNRRSRQIRRRAGSGAA